MPPLSLPCSSPPASPPSGRSAPAVDPCAAVLGALVTGALRLGDVAALPADLYPLASRPSFTPDGKTDSAAYAWLVWGPGRGGRWFAPMEAP